MFKFVIEIFIGAMIILGLITQVLYPMFSSKELFWLFKLKKNSPETEKLDEIVDRLKRDTLEKEEALKMSVNKVNTTIDELEKIRKRNENN